MNQDLKNLYLSAEGGDADAMFRLGQRYKNAGGNPDNCRKWIVWTTRAAERGHPNAIKMLESTVIPKLHRIVHCNQGNKNFSNDAFCASKWYQNAKASFEKGAGRPYKEPQFSRASKMSGFENNSFFADTISEQAHCDKSLKGKNDLQKTNAEFGSTLGTCLEDRLLETSLPSNVSFETARLIDEAKAGSPKAQNYIGICYREGSNGFPLDHKKGAQWYRRAAMKGYAQAQANLAQCYENGEGVPKNRERALEWWHKAAEGDQIDANLELGYKRLKGLGLPQDYTMAFEHLQKAANKGKPRAQYLLSNLYMNGNGVSQDVYQAIYWCVSAARLKDKDAIEQLDRDMYELLDGLKEAIGDTNAPQEERQNAFKAYDILNEYKRDIEQSSLSQVPYDDYMARAISVDPHSTNFSEDIGDNRDFRGNNNPQNVFMPVVASAPNNTGFNDNFDNAATATKPPRNKLTGGQIAGFIIYLIFAAGLIVVSALYPIYIYPAIFDGLIITSPAFASFVSYVPYLISFIACWLTVGLSLMLFDFYRQKGIRARRFLIPGLIGFFYFLARCLHHIVILFRLDGGLIIFAAALGMTIVVALITLLLTLINSKGAHKALVVFMLLFALAFAFSAIAVILTREAVTGAFSECNNILTFAMHIFTLAFIPTIMVAALRIKRKLKIKRDSTIIFLSLFAPFMALIVVLLVLIAAGKTDGGGKKGGASQRVPEGNNPSGNPYNNSTRNCIRCAKVISSSEYNRGMGTCFDCASKASMSDRQPQNHGGNSNQQQQQPIEDYSESLCPRCDRYALNSDIRRHKGTGCSYCRD